MPIVALAAAAILAAQTPTPQQPQSVTQTPPVVSDVPELTPAQRRSRDRAHAEQICTRRAPTGRRLEQTTCVSREMAAAQARAGQDELDKVTLQSAASTEVGD